jgi:hypothetical protein
MSSIRGIVKMCIKGSVGEGWEGGLQSIFGRKNETEEQIGK